MLADLFDVRSIRNCGASQVINTWTAVKYLLTIQAEILKFRLSLGGTMRNITLLIPCWNCTKWYDHVPFKSKGRQSIWPTDHSRIWVSRSPRTYELKVARSDLWVTIPFNFERLELHHYQSDRKSNISDVLEKDESFKWSTFHQDLSYHSNEMTPCPILHRTE